MGKRTEKGKHADDGKKGVQKATSKHAEKGKRAGKVELPVPVPPARRVSRKSSPSTVSTTSTEKGEKSQFVYSTPPHRVTKTQSPPDGSRSKHEKRGLSPAGAPEGRRSALKSKTPELETKRPEEIQKNERKDKEKKEKKQKIEMQEDTKTRDKTKERNEKVSRTEAKQTKPASSTAGKEKKGKEGKKKEEREEEEKAQPSESEPEMDADAEFDELCRQIEEQSTDDEQEEEQEEENEDSDAEGSESDDPGEVDLKEPVEVDKKDNKEDQEEEDESSSDPSQSDSESSSEGEPVPPPAVHPKSQQLVAAASSAVGATEAPVVANSVTHKNEYDTFSREILNKKKCPVSLSSYIQKDKNDLFNLWLQNNKSLKQVAVYIERRAEKINRTRSGRQGVKERELLEKYGSQEKVDKLKALLKAKGLFEFDPDFPQDEEEIYWYAGLGRKITSDAVTGETIAISGHEKNPNSELVAAITGETGPLHAGALPACGGSTEDADKNAWDSIMKTTTVKGKTPKNPKKAEGDEPEEVVPKTWKEKVVDLMEPILSQGAEARKMSLALKHVAYSGELTNQMLAHSKSMEGLYESCQKLVADNEPDESPKFAKLVNKVNSKTAWFEKAKAAGNALLAGLTGRKKKSKAKAKAKKADEE